MTRIGRWGWVVAVALAGACSGKGGAPTRSADGVVAAVGDHDVKVKVRDGRVLDFPMKENVKVMLGGGEASRAVVTEGAPVRVAYRGENDLVSIDVEPAIRAGSGEGKPPASGRFDAEAGNQGNAHTRPPTYDSGKR